MMYIERSLSEKILRLQSFFSVVVISGARQVGKSTLLSNLFKDVAEMVVFDPVSDIENVRRDPDLFLENKKTPLILDEIQYAPELIPAIKRRVDKHKVPGQYILTGSQQWGVLKSISESLAGRAAILDLEGFSMGEILEAGARKGWLGAWLDDSIAPPKKMAKGGKKSFTLLEQLWRGFLPQVQFIPKDVIVDYHSSYLRTYIERDIRLLENVSDLQQFSRFYKLAAALTAQETNFSQLGRDLGISPKTSQRWIDLLKATFQWFEIPPFSQNSIKRLSRKSKGYIADTGSACAALSISSPDGVLSHPRWGNIFETAVVAEIRKQMRLLNAMPNIFHWRTHEDAEVDVILEYNGSFFPIEIKAKSNPSRRDTSGITAFRKTYPSLNIAKGLVVCPCEKVVQLSENDYAIPWDYILE